MHPLKKYLKWNRWNICEKCIFFEVGLLTKEFATKLENWQLSTGNLE